MEMKKLQGLVAAPFTPFLSDGSIHPGLVPAYYELLKANGVSGAFIIGSTGEGVSLTLQEKKDMISAWGKAASSDKDFSVISFLGGTSLEECRQLAIYSAEAGMDAISITAPYYFKPANARLLAEACIQVAEAVPELPFYYYHIPVLTGVHMNMIDLLREIDGRCPNFAGIKFTHEDFMDYLSCIHFKDGKYDILWGRDENMLPALAVGAKGFVGSTYNYAAPLYHHLIEAYAKGNLSLARQWQQRSIDMIRLLGKYGGIATGKAFMKSIGLDCGTFRLPVANMGASAFAGFAADLEAIGFNAYCSKMDAPVNA